MADLFTELVSITLPERYLLRGRVAGNLIQLLDEPQTVRQIALDANTKGYFSDVADRPSVALVRRGVKPPSNYDHIVSIEEVVPISSIQGVLSRSSVRWQKPAPMEPANISLEDFPRRHNAIRATWHDALLFREEGYEGNTFISTGFRPPQIGAIHSIKAHWVVSDAPSTLVMPTGTGKTETMLAVFVSADVEKLLVIVPSDQLRTQISEKFVTLGVLKKFGLLKKSALYPIVATLKKRVTSLEEVDAIFGRAQVVITTMQSVSQLSVEMKDRIASHVTHLFVDEAHHIGAATWKAFKTHFVRQKRLILQFTATPYRNDNRRVDGKFIFVYPLHRAREQHLFRPVHYIPILDSDPAQADLSIIQEVGKALDRDLLRKLDHLAMARTSTIDRAQALLALYQMHLPRHAAELIHSGMPASQREDALRRLRTGGTRIIVCVNMLGEGFDLPRLKIAALHDRHHSEAVTLQFIGRFTRAEKGLGDASVIACVSLEDPREWLNALYKEDADWNSLLETGSEGLIEHQRRREGLYSGLDGNFEAIPIETVTPKLNTYVFKTYCDLWDPLALEFIETPSIGLVEGPIVNDDIRLVMAVTRHEDGLRWTRVKEPTNIVYNLVMAHWDQEKELLYVHSYPEDGLVIALARLLCGANVELLQGESVFRVLHGFRRVMLTNLGVKETQVKPIRFQLSTGIDITEQLELTVENRSRIKTNLFGTGYVDEPIFAGDDVDGVQALKRSIGCSTKGKIWSQEGTVSPDDWIRWCQSVGPKIADDSINTDMVLRNVLRPKRQQAFPAEKMPISIDWPEGLSVSDEDRTEIFFGEQPSPMSECELEISAFETGGPVRFRLRSSGLSAEFEAGIRDGVATFRHRTGAPVTITRGKRTRDILDLFREDPPAIRFTDGDMLIGADLASAPGDDKPLFDATKIEALSWKGVDIRQESQGSFRQAGTIQHSTIARLIEADPAYDVIFDGDASGEVADVVAIRRQGRFLDVELYHCKFSSNENPGARVEDLYEICGQAMKAVRWADPRSKFLNRLRRQEENRQKAELPTRFIVGDRPILDDWLANRRDLVTRFSMTLVQPGYSKAKANMEHLPILGSVEAYLHQTYNISMSFWGSS